jgi:hypothetical protein
MQSDAFVACAEQLAATPELVERLIRDHAPTSDGWCRAHEARRERHPCSIRALAELAAGIAQARTPA